MSDRPTLQSALQGRRIAPRKVVSWMCWLTLFERRQASVLRVPLVAIHDAPDQARVADWLQAFTRQPRIF